MATKDDIFAGALNLPPEQRAELARTLLESLDSEELSEADAQEAWGEELERRAQEILSGKVKGIPVEEVRRDIDALLARIRSERK